MLSSLKALEKLLQGHGKVWKRVLCPLKGSVEDDPDGVFAWEWRMWVGFVPKDTAFVQGEKENEETEKEQVS